MHRIIEFWARRSSFRRPRSRRINGGLPKTWGLLSSERLEAREMLSITVDTLLDEADGSITDGDISLRDAITLAASGDTIDFSVTGTIELVLGQLLIADTLTIAGPGADELTIDARGESRVVDVNDGDSNVQSDVRISGLTLTGGSVAGHGGGIQSVEDLAVTSLTISGNTASSGGGISNQTRGGTTTIENSTISGNSANFGGGIYTHTSDGSVTTIANSTISGNSIDGAIFGGGVFVDTSSGATTTISNSVVADNASVGPADRGGGIFAYTSLSGRLTIKGTTVSGGEADSGGGILATTTSDGVLAILGSTISGNYTNAYGGGITAYTYSGGSVTITDSAITGNSTNGWGGGVDVRTYSGGLVQIEASTISGNSAVREGGGLRARSGSRDAVDIHSSTISGNVASSGGGIHNFSGTLRLAHSTVTLNTASTGQGSGVASRGSGGTLTTVESSIIAGNTDTDVDAVGGDDDAFTSVGYNLIGDGNRATLFDNNDQTNVALPMLGPLTHHGGPTMTHALLPGSPAIDAGDPTAVAGVGDIPEFDQRGNPFARVVGAAIDIGSLEVAADVIIPGDGNGDGTVDGLDYLIWAANYGDNPADDPPGSPLNGDYNDDGMVDGHDYLVWAANYGTSATTVATQQQAALDVVLETEAKPTTGLSGSRTLPHHPRAYEHAVSRAFDAVFADLAVKKDPRHGRR